MYVNIKMTSILIGCPVLSPILKAIGAETLPITSAWMALDGYVGAIR